MCRVADSFSWDTSTSPRDKQEQLKNAQQIQANELAFAAILGDGSVVTWGSDLEGGDSTEVQHQLQNVQQIQTSDHA